MPAISIHSAANSSKKPLLSLSKLSFNFTPHLPHTATMVLHPSLTPLKSSTSAADSSISHLWDPGHKKVREMMRGSKEGGAYLAGFAMPQDGAVNMKGRGYHMVAGAVDVGMCKRFNNSLVDDEGEDGNDADDKYWSE